MIQLYQNHWVGKNTNNSTVVFIQQSIDNPQVSCIMVIIFKESEMKKRKKITPRNPLVALVKFRKAGSHRKTNKALRRKENSKKGNQSCLAYF